MTNEQMLVLADELALYSAGDNFQRAIETAESHLRALAGAGPVAWMLSQGDVSGEGEGS